MSSARLRVLVSLCLIRCCGQARCAPCSVEIGVPDGERPVRSCDAGEMRRDQRVDLFGEVAQPYANASGEDDVVGTIDGVGDADGAGEGAQRRLEAAEGFEGGGDVAEFFHEGGPAQVPLQRARAAVGAGGRVAFDGDVELRDVAGGWAVYFKRLS